MGVCEKLCHLMGVTNRNKFVRFVNNLNNVCLLYFSYKFSDKAIARNLINFRKVLDLKKFN